MRRMLQEIKESVSWISWKGFPGGVHGKKSACQRRWCRRDGFDLWVRKIPYSRKWQPAPVFLPGKFHGQRSLESYNPWGCKELDVTEHPEKVMAGWGSQLELGWWIRQGRVQGFMDGWTQWVWRRHKGLLTLGRRNLGGGEFRMMSNQVASCWMDLFNSRIESKDNNSYIKNSRKWKS